MTDGLHKIIWKIETDCCSTLKDWDLNINLPLFVCETETFVILIIIGLFVGIL